jgi:hypothetical protein
MENNHCTREPNQPETGVMMQDEHIFSKFTVQPIYFISGPSFMFPTHFTSCPFSATPWPLPPPARRPHPCPGPRHTAPRRRVILPPPALPARSHPCGRPRRAPPLSSPLLSAPRRVRLRRGLPRASRPDLLPPDLAFPLLIAPLAASPSSRIASCLVKAVAALASCVLRSAPRFPPHDHPFIQARGSGADGARLELPRQAARMVAEGVDGVIAFLRPLVMLAAVRKGGAPFARDLSCREERCRHPGA